jgi:hypothetical protein
MSGFASGIKGLFGKKPKPVITMMGPDPENAQNNVVFAGHGSYNPEVDGRYNGGKVRLPPGVTMYFWCRHGESLSGPVGRYIDENKDIRKLPRDLMKLVRERGKSTDIPEIVHGGQEVWNYRLEYPFGLGSGQCGEGVGAAVDLHQEGGGPPGQVYAHGAEGSGGRSSLLHRAAAG